MFMGPVRSVAQRLRFRRLPGLCDSEPASSRNNRHAIPGSGRSLPHGCVGALCLR
jgi:hypothetical protein